MKVNSQVVKLTFILGLATSVDSAAGEQYFSCNGEQEWSMDGWNDRNRERSPTRREPEAINYLVNVSDSQVELLKMPSPVSSESLSSWQLFPEGDSVVRFGWIKPSRSDFMRESGVKTNQCRFHRTRHEMKCVFRYYYETEDVGIMWYEERNQSYIASCRAILSEEFFSKKRQIAAALAEEKAKDW